MNRKLKKILISNDDGIQAKGIQTLTKKLREYGHDVNVVAPSEDSSGMSHGITLKMPLRYKEFELDGAFFGYMINGKPADCVKMARWEIYKDIELTEDIIVPENKINITRQKIFKSILFIIT